jgi:hypothetical protein
MGDPKCTHVVVDDANVTTLPQGLLAPNSDTSVVKSEWFWASIQVKNPFVIPNLFDKGSSSHQFIQALFNTEQIERNYQHFFAVDGCLRRREAARLQRPAGRTDVP